MWKYSLVIGVAFFSTVQCLLTYPNSAFASPPLPDSEASKIVEEGRSPMYFVTLDEGSFQINDMKNIRFWEEMGIVTLSKSNKGGNWMDIAITEKGKRISERDDKGRYRIKIADMKVTKIIKNSIYRTPRANLGDELRIVMGIYECNPTRLGKMYLADKGFDFSSSYKFRALLKYDKYKEKYEYITSDSGELNKDKYKTNNVENYNIS